LWADSNKLPSISGIYFVLDAFETVRYVGLSKNLKLRMASHRKAETFQLLGEARIAYLAVSDISSLPAMEIALIKRFSPNLNRTIGGETGRQAAFESRLRRVSLTFSDREHEHVSKYAEETEQSVNSVIRQLVRRWNPEEKDL